MTAPKPHLDFQHFLVRLSGMATIPIRGSFFRLIVAARAEAIAETGGSFEFGGRFNSPGIFGGLYLAESVELAWLEIQRNYHGRTNLIPDHVLGEFGLQLGNVLDLSDPGILEALAIDRADIIDAVDRRIPRHIGQAAWMLGIEAIRFPSCPAPDQFNLVVFVDHLNPESRILKQSVQLFRPRRLKRV